MYQKCPKCRHERTPSETGPADACPACGLIFSKYLKARLAPVAVAPAPAPGVAAVAAPSEPVWLERARAIAFYVPDEVESTYVYLRGLLLAGLIVYGVKLAAMDIPSWEM